MRDIEIIKQNHDLKMRVALLYQQINFLNARQRAFEMVFADQEKYKAAFENRDTWFKEAVDAIQMEILKQEAEAAKAEALKPRLTVVGAN